MLGLEKDCWNSSLSLFDLVSSKIRALNDFYNNIASGITPVPSGFDIANAVKYFSQTLLG
jgi:hypothetical protein